MADDTFVIKKVDDVDTSRVKRDVDLAKGLGEITVTVHRVEEKPRVSQKNKQYRSMEEGITEISEKALKGKAISHGVG